MTHTRLILSTPVPLAGTHPAFSTYQAMNSLIEAARSSLFLVFYAITDSAAPLVEAVAAKARSGVRVTFCLDDGTNAAVVLSRLWPADAPRPRVLVPNRKLWSDGNLHAKLIIADGESAIVTSANLTGWATDSNLEIGVQLGEEEARELRDHILSLLRSHALVRPDPSASSGRRRGRKLVAGR